MTSDALYDAAHQIHNLVDPGCEFDRVERCSAFRLILDTLSKAWQLDLITWTAQAPRLFPEWISGADSEFHYQRGWNDALRAVTQANAETPKPAKASEVQNGTKS